MSAASRAATARDPEAARQRAIANLPKNASGARNGNWRGGKTKEKRDFATVNSSKIKKWREAVFERDGHKCKNCGDTERLEAHHIIPLVQATEFAFIRPNGVTLCRRCHQETDSYGTLGRGLGAVGGLACIVTIPHHWQDYETVGNWFVGTEGTIAIFVSDMGNWRYEALVAFHELAEVLLCKSRGITTEQVDAFDKAFANGEPGDDPGAPYHKEHRFASKAECKLADELGVDWLAYDDAVMSL